MKAKLMGAAALATLRRIATAAVALSVLASTTPVRALDYTYRLDHGHLVIDATGQIEADEGVRFQAFLGNLPATVFNLAVGRPGSALVLNSTGGRVGGAIAMGQLLADWQFSTGVAQGGQCASACVLARAAGVHKSAPASACIGVHQAFNAPGEESTPTSEHEATAAMGVWLGQHGAPYEVLVKMGATPSYTINCLSAADLAAWHVNLTDSPQAPPVASSGHCAELMREYQAAENHVSVAIEQDEYGQANKSLAAGLRVMSIGRQVLTEDCPLSDREAFQRHIEEGERINQRLLDQLRKLSQ